MSDRARKAAERLRREVAEHAAGPDCGDPQCIFHARSDARPAHPNTMIGRP